MPPPIYEDWLQWHSEMPLLADKYLPRCYFNKGSQIIDKQLYGFGNASQNAYAAAVYLWMVDTFGKTQIYRFAAKTKVALIKQLTIPNFSLTCIIIIVMHVPLSRVQAWKDSTIVLN